MMYKLKLDTGDFQLVRPFERFMLQICYTGDSDRYGLFGPFPEFVWEPTIVKVIVTSWISLVSLLLMSFYAPRKLAYLMVFSADRSPKKCHSKRHLIIEMGQLGPD